MLLLLPLRYDQAVYSADFCERLGVTTLAYMHTLEAAILRLLEFDTAVPRTLYLRYCFALQEMIPPTALYVGDGIAPLPLESGTAVPSSPGCHRRTRSDGDMKLRSMSM